VTDDECRGNPSIFCGANVKILNEQLLSTRESTLWEKYLPVGRSVFGSIGYARICERHRNCTPRLFVLAGGKESICYPMLLHSTDELPFAGVHRGMWDAGSPEFTGPLGHGVSKQFALMFRNRCAAAFRSERIITEFAHLNPWTDNSHLLESNCLHYNREIVWVDVSLNPDILWIDHFAPACRRNISRAQKEGVRILCASTDDVIREFHRIYIQTMQRNHAQPSYYFTHEYFATIRDELGAHARFVLAEYKGQIIAATLYLHDETNVFFYLGGSDESFQNVRPTNALHYDTICWAHAAGKKRLILGGGYKPDDGIFRFKATFSRHRQAFHTYRRVHLEDNYIALSQSWRAYYNAHEDDLAYFPVYRRIPEYPLQLMTEGQLRTSVPV
jgi:hypothetical protein